MEKHDPAHKFQIVGPFEVTLDSVKDLLVLARQPEAQGALRQQLIALPLRGSHAMMPHTALSAHVFIFSLAHVRTHKQS
jgi:hypothetical protein